MVTVSLPERLPMMRMRRAATEVPAIMAIMGVAVALLKAPMPMEAMAPMPIWRAPRRAEAVPAFLEKGARERAAALGLVKPRQPRKRKMKKMVWGSPYQPAILPTRKTAATRTWPESATQMICWLLYLFSRRLLNWLRPMKATERKAKIQP